MNTIFAKEFGMNPAKLQSLTIDLLRFPLAIMVLFIHMSPKTTNLLDADFSMLSVHGFNNVMGILLSHVLTHIAVPTFYLISGFLFFANFQEWSWAGYRKKMSSRVKTLLIPYMLWNAVPFLLLVIAMFARVVMKGQSIDSVLAFVSEKSWHVFYDYKVCATTRVNWLGENLASPAPFNVPLWFLRDLIVVTILTPVIYCAIKKLKLFIIGVLFIANLSRVWTLIPGFSITAFFFFTTGAYFALNKINIIEFTSKYKLVILPSWLVLLCVTTFYDGGNTIVGHNIYPLFVCMGVLSAFYIASVCVSKYSFKPNKLLVSCCFFIYAIHLVKLPFASSPLYIVRGIFHRIIPGNTDIEETFCYLATPFVTACLCILLFVFARRFFPGTTKYFSGNR